MPLDDVWVAGDFLWMEDIFQLEKISRQIHPYMDSENPLLLIYCKETWELMLQLLDLKELLKFERIVLYDNIVELELSLIKTGIQFPRKIIGTFEKDLNVGWIFYG